MNGYIINPAVFYWMNVFENVQLVCSIIGAIALISFACLTIYTFYLKENLLEPQKDKYDENDWYDKMRYEKALKTFIDDKNYFNKIKKYNILSMIVGILLILIAIFIPNKQASIEMLIAKTATFDNTNWSIQQIKEIIDYIVMALKGVL